MERNKQGTISLSLVLYFPQKATTQNNPLKVYLTTKKSIFAFVEVKRNEEITKKCI